MEERDREMLIRIDENVKRIKEVIPSIKARVLILEKAHLVARTKNKVIHGILFAGWGLILAALSGFAVWWKKG